MAGDPAIREQDGAGPVADTETFRPEADEHRSESDHPEGILARFLSSVGHALSAPLRWLGRKVASGLQRLTERRKRGGGGQPGFGFRWLLVALLLAAVVALIVGLALSPVLGLVALLVVAVWMAVRSDGDDHDSEGSEDSGGEAAAPMAA